MANELDTDDSTIDDTIRETLRELNTPVETENEPDPAAIGKDEKAAPQIKARDESGKFTKQDAKNSAAPETPVQTPQDKDGDEIQRAAEPEQPLTTTTGQPIDINRAPASWKPAAKAEWAALPEHVRAEVYRRESDFLNGNKGLKENADFGQSIKSTLEPYRMLIEAEGGTPELAVRDLMKTAALFRVGSPQQKLDALKQIDAQYNCGLNADFSRAVQAEVARITGQAPQGQQVQPAQQQFQDPRIDQIMQSMQAQERTRAKQEEAVSNAATERFISAKDSAGHPLYPFVDNVLDDMSQRVTHIRGANPSMNHEEVLKQAYEAAVWANPETRAVLISQQQAAAQLPVANQLKTDQAKRASRTNFPKRGSLPAGEAAGSIEDTIRDTYRTLTG